MLRGKKGRKVIDDCGLKKILTAIIISSLEMAADRSHKRGV